MASFVVVVSMLMMVASGTSALEGEGEVHHVVGGDQGWDLASDVNSWAIPRSFKLGDHIWLSYSAAHESIAELGSQAEYNSCDTANPIRMYTSGLDKIKLDRQGPRYFVSSSANSCSKGLKLHLHVQPQQENKTSQQVQAVAAAGPQPSGSVKVMQVSALSVLLLTALANLCFF